MLTVCYLQTATERRESLEKLKKKKDREVYGTHQVLAYADDVNLIGDDVRTIERNADVLLNVVRILV